MGKAGSVLGIIGILLGAGGLGFGFIAWNAQNSMQANLVAQDIWYKYDQNTFTVNPAFSYLHIPDMSIVFDLAATASVHILFTCLAGVFAEPTEYAGITFYFSIDGIRLIQPWVNVGTLEGSSLVDYFSVALQHFIPSFSSGTHNISVMVYSAETINYVGVCSLTIQSVAD